MGYLRERRVALAIASAMAIAAFGGGLVGCGGGNDDDSGSTDVSASDQAALGQDAEAKAAARNAQVSLEVYATDRAQNGSYEGATVDSLSEIEPTLADADLTVTAAGQTYEVTATSESGNSFTLSRDAQGTISRSCETEGDGGCPDGGEW